MLLVGPNPYGLTCTLGLQGKAEHPKNVMWFVGLAEAMSARAIELHFASLPSDAEALDELRDRLASHAIQPVVSGPAPLATIAAAIPVAKRLGAKVVRTHLSPILCGARAAQGEHWNEIVRGVRSNIAELGPKFADAELTLAIENHQDFGSEEMLEFCELGGPSVGITLDTGNPLAVCEEPIAFTRAVCHKVRHLHLKDYRAQPTPEGFRLVRCAIGDGAIPLQPIADVLAETGRDLTATLEPGALEARHVKLLTPEWWHGYRERSEADKLACLEATKTNALVAEEDYRTPWERGESAQAICDFEMEHMNKSVQNMISLGWLPA